MYSSPTRTETSDVTRTGTATSNKTVDTLSRTESTSSGFRAPLSVESASLSGRQRAGVSGAQEPTGTTVTSRDATSEDRTLPSPCADASMVQDQRESEIDTQDPTFSTGWVPIEDARSPTTDICIPNIIVFGETGVGKSSIINLIAGQPLADTSTEARGTMARNQPYDGTLGGIKCRLWDTVGLNEGSVGDAPPNRAENNLKKLIQRLARVGGINLLVYCVRSGRLKKIHQRTYQMFYSEVCQKKVPIALVTTNLEHEEEEMERWWRRNDEHIRKLGMLFNAHACVTTDPDFAARRVDSQKLLRSLVFRSLQDVLIPNIVILGETGAGKSSVINLIAGEMLQRALDAAPGCSFQNHSYDVSVDNVKCRLWRITGLDGTKGKAHMHQTESDLKELIQRMAHAGGINLLVCCIRGARLTKALRFNYDIFYSGVCRKKVPIALVITGLENEKKGMEAWWETNEKTLRDHGMRFDAHACVTTLDLGDEDGKERQLHSQRRLRNLIVTYSKRPPWKISASFMSLLFPMLRSLLRVTPSPSQASPRMVIICDMAPDSPIVSECAPGITNPISMALIGGQRYEFVRIDKHSLQSFTMRHAAGLLIFYTSPLVDAGILPDDADTLRRFYDAAGGLMCPMIVVLRGCSNDDIAQTCWNDVVLSHNDIQAYSTSLSDASQSDGSSHGEKKLMHMVERLWVNPGPVQSGSQTLAWTTKKA